MGNRAKNQGRRTSVICIFVVLGLTAVLVSKTVQGQEAKFPSKPIEVLVPYAPGGIIDILARIFAEPLSRELKVPVIIKNQAGGGGLTGSTAFMNTKPDGYTMLSGCAGATMSTVLLSNTPPFDPRKDLLPVGYMGDSPIAMAVPKASPFKSFDDFLAFAKNNPGKLIGGVSGLGAENHIMFMSLLKDTKIKTKLVPFTSGGQLITALLGGHLDWLTNSLPQTLNYERSGDLRTLLLTRSSKELPGVPSGRDKGLPSVTVSTWNGFFVLPQTPKAAYDRLISAVEVASKDPEAVKKVAEAGFNVEYKTPREFSNLIKEQWDMLSRIIEETGMKVN
jgi:tripartite-type tricarboxylate transporter receptor subunit TctC